MSGRIFRARFHSDENDSYVELWKLVGRAGYIARHTYGPKRWYYVGDPLGYRELDHPIGDDVTIIVCGRDGRELFRTSNADGSADFNTPKQEAYARWAEYAKGHDAHVGVEDHSAQFFVHWATGTPVGGFNQWLLSFQDPELYDEAKDYAENWLWCHNERLGGFETLAEYAYLGEPKKIERCRFRHRICRAEWYEYYAGDYLIGHGFDGSRTGPMYSEAEARKILTAAIMASFPDARAVSLVRSYTPYGTDEPYHKEQRVRIERAWERIAAPDSPDGRGPKNLCRSFVDAEAAKERERSRFFGSFDEIKEIYPDCVRDWSFM